MHRRTRRAGWPALALTLWLVSPVAIGQEAGDEEPPVPFRLGVGMEKFETLCAECHGQWANGTEKGPSLIHSYYVSSHHSDEAFFRAILRGSPQHHWEFGDMPPVDGATLDDAKHIVPYVRWLQKYRRLE